MTKKPYYKLVVGPKPHTSADMRFPAGRVRIEVSDALKDRIPLHSLLELKWGAQLQKIEAFYASHPSDVRVTLQEPSDRPLRAEVERTQGRG